MQGGDYFGVAGETEIIAAGEIGKFTSVEADVGAVELLERWSFGHSSKFKVQSSRCLLRDLDEVTGEEWDVFAGEEAFGIDRNGLAVADDHYLAGLDGAIVASGDNCFGKCQIMGPLDGGKLDGADKGDNGFVGFCHAGHGGLLAGHVSVAGLSLGFGFGDAARESEEDCTKGKDGCW